MKSKVTFGDLQIGAYFFWKDAHFIKLYNIPEAAFITGGRRGEVILIDENEEIYPMSGELEFVETIHKPIF